MAKTGLVTEGEGGHAVGGRARTCAEIPILQTREKSAQEPREVPRAAKHQEMRRKRTLMHLSHPPVAKIPAPPAWGMNLHERMGASWPATWAIVTSDEEEHKERSRQQAHQRDVQEAREKCRRDPDPEGWSEEHGARRVSDPGPATLHTPSSKRSSPPSSLSRASSLR